MRSGRRTQGDFPSRSRPADESEGRRAETAGIVVANNLYLKADGTPKPLAIHNGPGDGAYARVTNNVWPARTKPLPY